MSESENNVNSAEQRAGYVDYKKLTFVKALVKFFSPDKGFGFVTLLDKDGNKTQDAFLPGAKLTQAGYEEIASGQEIIVKHTLREKGEAVVLVKHPPGYSSDAPNNAPVKIRPPEDRHAKSEDKSDDVSDTSENQVQAPDQDVAA